jgi:hypothetical protein
MHAGCKGIVSFMAMPVHNGAKNDISVQLSETKNVTNGNGRQCIKTNHIHHGLEQVVIKLLLLLLLLLILLLPP